MVSIVYGPSDSGLTVAGPENGHNSPLSVSQERLDTEKNKQVIFSQIENIEDNVAHESTNLNSKFSIFINCKETTVWKVHCLNGVDEWVATFEEDEGYHCLKTLNNMFKVQKCGLYRWCKFHFSLFIPLYTFNSLQRFGHSCKQP